MEALNRIIRSNEFRLDIWIAHVKHYDKEFLRAHQEGLMYTSLKNDVIWSREQLRMRLKEYLELRESLDDIVWFKLDVYPIIELLHTLPF